MDPKLSSDKFSEYLLDDQNLPKEEDFNCYLCSATYEKDLQLAAELGKTLLERNKELETSLKNHQNIIEDQSQEIDYLAKQTAALKEVNTSRIKIYEQLEISIQELEHSKETLLRQSAADKKQIKSLQETVITLEGRCDELQSAVDRLTAELEKEKRQRVLDATEINKDDSRCKASYHNDAANGRNSEENNDEYENLTIQIQELKTTSAKDQKIIEDFRDQISILLRENNYLQELLDDQQHKDEELKTLQEELATLEQIRFGNLCKRCLRSIIPTEDCSSADELSLVLANEEEQELARSIASALFNNEKSSPTLKDHADNPYRMLVEKYEALLKMQEQQHHWVRQRATTKSAQCMSLRDELQLSGNFYDKKEMTDSEFEDEHDDQEARRKLIEANNQKAVTTSPGSGDDVVHKGTQTEVLAASLPGSFLCKISDGNDCQFSIYDDASPVESRFRKTPEYRQLFKEIFAVLKRAAEAKDEGESLPLLDDRLPTYVPTHLDLYQQPKVPPVTPAREEQPFVIPDCEVSTATATKPVDDPILPPLPQEVHEVTSTTGPIDIDEKPPQQRDVMEHLMAGVTPKRNLSRGDRRALDSAHKASPSPSPCNSRSSSKRRSGSKIRKKRERLTDSPNRSRDRHQQKSNRAPEELEIFAKMSEKAEIHDAKKVRPVSMYAFGSGSSSASMEVAKLKILEKSYAEVLRMGRKKTAVGKSTFM